MAESKDARFESSPTAQSHFSWLRTRLSIEGTMMSWVRTSVALIGFGFTIVQFYERLAENPNVRKPLIPEMPRYLGLGLIGIGVLALALAMLQYKKLNAYLWEDFRSLAGVGAERARSPLIPVATCLLLVGLLAFLAVLLRV